MSRATALKLLLCGVAVSLVPTSTALAAPAVDGEFDIPSGVGSNNEIVQGPDGNMWVTLENANGVARITPDGTVDEFSLANSASGITVGPDNNIWVSTLIGVATIPPANPAARESFLLGGFANGRGITTGPDGKLWVVGGDELVSFAAADPINTADPNTIPGMNGNGMATGSDGLLWIADGGGDAISATAQDTPVVTKYPVGGGLQDIAAGQAGQVGYANPGDTPHEVGLIVPGGTPQQIPLETSDPFGITFAPDGAYWVARSSTDDLLRLAPDGTTSTLTGFSDAPNVGPRKVAVGPTGTLWVTLDDQEKVARVTGVVAPPPNQPAPDTEITKAPKKKVKTKPGQRKAKVRFKFTSPTAGATFECKLKRKGKNPAFRPCESPKRYKLKPARYRFKVRAVAGGVVDPTPAKHRFRVVRG